MDQRALHRLAAEGITTPLLAGHLQVAAAHGTTVSRGGKNSCARLGGWTALGPHKLSGMPQSTAAACQRATPMLTCNIAESAHAAALLAWHACQALRCLVGICYCTLASPNAAASTQSPGNALLLRGTRACERVCMCMLSDHMSCCVRT